MSFFKLFFKYVLLNSLSILKLFIFIFSNFSFYINDILNFVIVLHDVIDFNTLCMYQIFIYLKFLFIKFLTINFYFKTHSINLFIWKKYYKNLKFS